MIFTIFVKITRPLRGKGLGKIPAVAALYRFLYRKAAPKKMLLNINGHKMYVASQDMGVSGHLISQGIHEKYETELLKKIIKPGMTVVDIGANIGYYTLIMASLAGKKGKVYAFEPSPDNHCLLIKNIKINNYNNIIPVQKALADKIGKVKLFTSQTVFSSLSLAEENVPEKAGWVRVEATTLDKFFPKEKIGFIKMDVEGAEGLVAEGGDRVLKNNNLKIAMEFWPRGLKNLGTDPWDFLQKLQNYGFKVKLIDEKNCRLENIRPEEIIKKCGKEGVNLFLEK
ncbi:MAG: FkbM family methyltransferase [bacterium]